MEFKTTTRTAENIGTLITADYFYSLTRSFRNVYPQEVSSVILSKALLKEILNYLPDVAGIKFVGGLVDRNDPTSRQIILVPCNSETGNGAIPHSIFLAKGFWIQTGEKISLSKTWENMSESVERFLQLEPTMKRKEVLRSIFFGKISLQSLIETKGCENVKFHYGYTRAHSSFLEPCLEALDSNNQSLQVYLEVGQRCPCVDDNRPECCHTDGDCIITDSISHSKKEDALSTLNMIREFRDKWLVKDNPSLFEMYYDISPSLAWKISNDKKAGNVYEDIFSKYISPTVKSINEKKYESVKHHFVSSMDELLQNHLINSH
jgi:hypothetical protein